MKPPGTGSAVDQEKPSIQLKSASASESNPERARSAGLQDVFRRMKAELGRSKPGQEKIEAALEAAQRMALQMDVDASVGSQAEAQERRNCQSCGSQNPRQNRFCARCGVPLHDLPEGDAPAPDEVKLINPLAPAGQHYYHHHYHHHYFASSADGVETAPEQRPAAVSAPRDGAKIRTPGGTGLSRAETALHKLAQDWALACNTKHLDDLVELYMPDATVLRPNISPVRSTPAIRELFFSSLEAGLGEVEMEPLRVEVFGEIAYEVGRCTMLAPTALGKRREERGKYVIVAVRQAGEWKIVVDCWSTDLSLAAGTEPAKPASGSISASKTTKGN
jgi:ketosteroid isomerase-like protein